MVDAASDILTVSPPATTDSKAVTFNGMIVPDEPKELGYGEWMLVARRNQTRTKPIEQAHNGMQKVNKGKAHVVPKTTPTPTGPVAQQNKPNSRSGDPKRSNPKPNIGKPKPHFQNSHKDKSSNSIPEHKFEFNPLLKTILRP